MPRSSIHQSLLRRQGVVAVITSPLRLRVALHPVLPRRAVAAHHSAAGAAVMMPIRQGAEGLAAAEARGHAVLVLPGRALAHVVLTTVLPLIVVVRVVRGHGGAAADEAVGHVLGRAGCLSALLRLRPGVPSFSGAACICVRRATADGLWSFWCFLVPYWTLARLQSRVGAYAL